MCMLSNDIYDYVNVSQGKITIPGMDDGEEFVLTDVSLNHLISYNSYMITFIKNRLLVYTLLQPYYRPENEQICVYFTVKIW